MIKIKEVVDTFAEGEMFDFTDECGQNKTGIVLTANGTLIYHKNFNEEYYHKFMSQDIVQEMFDTEKWKLR